MPLIPLKIPPGVFRNGTKYETKGRWYDSDLIRWFESALQPIGGWIAVLDSTDTQVNITNPGRGSYSWREDSGKVHLAVGTYNKAYDFSIGTLTDITPAGLTAGNQHAIVTSGRAFGEGVYGEGPYGGLVSDTREEIQEAGTWTFDNWGETLLGCMPDDATIYDWDLNVANDLTAVTNAPTAKSIVVTAERFLVALGAAGDRRLVQWSDQDDNTVWTPTADNQAGNFALPGGGELMAGRRGRNETLLWTDGDLWSMQYIGGDLIYRFGRVGANCGAISRHSMVFVDSQAFWMGERGFYKYDGFVQEVPCEVGDYVFSDLNTVQVSKIVCISNSSFGEVTWYYPSRGSIEIDRYVTYNYVQNIWSIGSLARTTGVDRNPHQYPIMVDTAGLFWEHERGYNYNSEATPYIESGPIEIGNGDEVMTVVYIMPDDNTVGDVNATLYMAFYPDGTETSFGPFTLSQQTSVRKTGRWIRLKLTEVNSNWRVGVPRIDIRPGGRR